MINHTNNQNLVPTNHLLINYWFSVVTLCLLCPRRLWRIVTQTISRGHHVVCNPQSILHFTFSNMTLRTINEIFVWSQRPTFWVFITWLDQLALQQCSAAIFIATSIVTWLHDSCRERLTWWGITIVLFVLFLFYRYYRHKNCTMVQSSKSNFSTNHY